MINKHLFLLVGLVLGMVTNDLFAAPRRSSRKTGSGNSRWGAGARLYAARDEAPVRGIPVTSDEGAAVLAYEFHENNAFWQLAVNYLPRIDGTNGLDYAVTPEINLVYKQSAWQMGVGVYNHHVWDAEGEHDWAGTLWQIMLGLNIPLGRSLSLDLSTFYATPKLDQLQDFDTKHLDYRILATFTF
ncbi:MAG: hypothetical protein A2498_14095 [Lentisphaerae bacterium RIFOXYC12_FULL_60_16]|nr:MAG: hypothetical protein A2498_14095 [Lentisphaerae bacterium RIFOXYC12_FULL_60_16]OGV73752.1 MAG: hypothetical protein A2269_04615 [Lentisphaerae bacterium RIFOXYA12_FULL_60_10]OGV86620.1 MAG: hypothetical protein A2340_03030 [Lentisphaerae bacterium RIFOXYB12_FULL_60_10]